MNRSDDDTFFPELEGEERRQADAWLDDYLRIVIRIYKAHLERVELSTATELTTPEVLKGSVQLDIESQQHEEGLWLHANIGPETGKGCIDSGTEGGDFGVCDDAHRSDP
jgi:hypothetical protein